MFSREFKPNRQQRRQAERTLLYGRLHISSGHEYRRLIERRFFGGNHVTGRQWRKYRKLTQRAARET